MIKIASVGCSTLWIFFLTFITGASGAEEFADQIKKPVEESIAIRQNSQKNVEKWASEKNDLEAEFDSLTEVKKSYSAEIERISEQIRISEQNTASLENQIMSAQRISDQLMPFLRKTHAELAEMIKQPPRFLMDERSARLENLGRILDDSQIAPGEKFRKLMEALLIEAGYGNTVEVYQEKITLNNNTALVNILRVGRTALFFETLDQKTCGHYNIAAERWEDLPKNKNRDIHMAVEIGSKLRPADIVSLPLGRISFK